MQELALLDKNNNPLTHAKYHIEQVQEAKERHRRPPALEIPQYLQENIKEYLAQVSFLLVTQLEVNSLALQGCVWTLWIWFILLLELQKSRV